MSATPQTDRIERDELAVMAREFRSVAERLRSSSYVYRVTGRATASVRSGTRAWAYDEAARICHDQLQQQDEA